MLQLLLAEHWLYVGAEQLPVPLQRSLADLLPPPTRSASVEPLFDPSSHGDLVRLDVFAVITGLEELAQCCPRLALAVCGDRLDEPLAVDRIAQSEPAFTARVDAAVAIFSHCSFPLSSASL
ncbi:hypothetical protein [Bradyrhizobium sp. AZCC 2289]|uniref:hypothetical protein n=1 Tax=Bradyrhizobium sp. AZCC 2289 TaxID=3117026 RepID=UPI002FF42679